MQNRLILVIAFVACGVAAGVGFWVGPDSENPDDQPEKPAVQNYDKELAKAYVDQNCWQCHSVSTLTSELERDFGPFASGARPTGPDLAGIGLLYGREWHIAHLKDPQLLSPGSLMPAQDQLFDDSGKLGPLGERVIGFLMSLDVPSNIRTEWPTAPQQTSKIPVTSNGAELFQKYCASCHGQSADGHGPAAYWLKSTPPADIWAGNVFRRYTDEPMGINDVYTTVTNGIRMRNMPSFNGVLSKQERTDVAAYVMKLYNKARVR
ncbi:MAG: c-type cytochrome [Planctomycetota bacterium]|jgi:cbb3-type cytochrome oxidase cytochrome c subunit